MVPIVGRIVEDGRVEPLPRVRGGNRVFTRAEAEAIWGPHPRAHLGEEIRRRIRARPKGPWWKQPPPEP